MIPKSLKDVFKIALRIDIIGMIIFSLLVYITNMLIPFLQVEIFKEPTGRMRIVLGVIVAILFNILFSLFLSFFYCRTQEELITQRTNTLLSLAIVSNENEIKKNGIGYYVNLFIDDVFVWSKWGGQELFQFLASCASVALILIYLFMKSWPLSLSIVLIYLLYYIVNVFIRRAIVETYSIMRDSLRDRHSYTLEIMRKAELIKWNSNIKIYLDMIEKRDKKVLNDRMRNEFFRQVYSILPDLFSMTLWLCIIVINTFGMRQQVVTTDLLVFSMSIMYILNDPIHQWGLYRESFMATKYAIEKIDSFLSVQLAIRKGKI